MTPTHRNGTPLDVALRIILTPPMWILGRLLRHWTPLPYPEPVAAQPENSSQEGRMRGGRGADTPRPRDRTSKEFSQ